MNRKKMITKLDKKSLKYLGIIVIIATLVCVGSFYYLSQVPEIEIKLLKKKPSEKTLGEIIRELTTPRGEPKPLPEKIINDLISSKKGGKTIPLPGEIVNSLTTPK